MKHLIRIVFVLISLLISACETEGLKQVGFNSAIQKNSHGLTILYVNSESSILVLKGNIELTQGEVCVELENPENEIVFSKTINSTDIVAIHESFQSHKGYWKLRYKSIDGDGNITLHLSN